MVNSQYPEDILQSLEDYNIDIREFCPDMEKEQNCY